MLIYELIGGRQNYHENEGSPTIENFQDWIYRDLEQENVPTRCLPLTEEENHMRESTEKQKDIEANEESIHKRFSDSENNSSMRRRLANPNQRIVLQVKRIRIITKKSNEILLKFS
ncbi:hypothetical protein PIB30_077832 [Stylosanthes scabra]|uniref:Uncharacterized protein n=1 Tax=Stylosanthes scabra TaxID=79078 RepID=A0ABU6ZPD6_9FABA|nr:hypothetical protein [Stylosanthes scabra]